MPEQLIGRGGHREAGSNDETATIFHASANGFEFVERHFVLLGHDAVFIDESVMNKIQSIRPVALPRAVPTMPQTAAPFRSLS